LVAAAAIALVLLFLTGPLQYVPDAALGAVLVMAAFSLFNVADVRMLWHESKSEFAICVVATLGVVAVGAIDAIAFAVILAMLRFVRMVARPTCEVLGRIEGRGFHSVERHPQAVTVPGLCLFRFNAPVVFFNAPYFRQEARRAVAAAGRGLRFFVIDAIPITGHDVTGRAVLRELDQELLAQGVQIVIAGRETELMEWREKTGMDHLRPIKVRQFPTLADAVDALQAQL
jgi:MFS superfamily sulfate permease-like transporter